MNKMTNKEKQIIAVFKTIEQTFNAASKDRWTDFKNGIIYMRREMRKLIKLMSNPDNEMILPENIELVPTGSRVYGIINDTSDYDFIVKPKDYNKLNDFLNEHKWDHKIEQNGDYNSDDVDISIKFHQPNGIVNFIIPHKDHYNAWIKTTEILKTMPKSLLREKERRVNIFRKVFFAELSSDV